MEPNTYLLDKFQDQHSLEIEIHKVRESIKRRKETGKRYGAKSLVPYLKELRSHRYILRSQSR